MGAGLATDRLMKMCEKHAEKIAESWYQALIKNDRTRSFSRVPKESVQRHVIAIYKSVPKLYFAKNAYDEVKHFLDVEGLVEDLYARGIPLEDLLYALVLARRYIWLIAESESLFELNANDLYEAMTSTNRMLLIFDYLSYISAHRYRELSEAKKH